MALEDLLYPLLSAYIASPQWVKLSIGRAYSWLPTNLGRGKHYPALLRDALQHDPTVLAKLQGDKLSASLRWALESVPAYKSHRHLLPQVALNPHRVLAQMPLLSKDDLKNNLVNYLSNARSASKRLKTFTGGSTASALMFYLEKGISRPKEYAFMEDFHRRIGFADDEVVLALRGRSVPTAKHPGGRLWMYEPIKRQLILSSDHLERRYMAEYVDAMRQWKPRFIQAFPSAVIPLARWLKEYPDPVVTQAIRGIMLFSENVYDDQMALLRSVFDCPILKHYGHSERVLMAASMPDDERCFFWPQYGLVELIDEHGQTIAPDQIGVLGELVGTSFDNQVMPMLRYRTGDMAMWSATEHPQLPGFPVVERIEGRLQEFIVCQDQRLISICTIGAAHLGDLAAVETMQYEQYQTGHFILKVVTRTPLSEAARQRMVKAVVEKTQGGCTAEIVEVGQIARTSRGKHKMLIQHLDLSKYFGSSLQDIVKEKDV